MVSTSSVIGVKCVGIICEPFKTLVKTDILVLYDTLKNILNKVWLNEFRSINDTCKKRISINMPYHSRQGLLDVFDI